MDPNIFRSLEPLESGMNCSVCPEVAFVACKLDLVGEYRRPEEM